jgi:hypothetical protein
MSLATALDESNAIYRPPGDHRGVAVGIAPYALTKRLNPKSDRVFTFTLTPHPPPQRLDSFRFAVNPTGIATRLANWPITASSVKVLDQHQFTTGVLDFRV